MTDLLRIYLRTFPASKLNFLHKGDPKYLSLTGRRNKRFYGAVFLTRCSHALKPSLPTLSVTVCSDL